LQEEQRTNQGKELDALCLAGAAVHGAQRVPAAGVQVRSARLTGATPSGHSAAAHAQQLASDQQLGMRIMLRQSTVNSSPTCAAVVLFLLCRVNTTGVAVQQFVTTSPKLFEPYKDEDIHGGPPLIHVPAHLSSLGRDYFLGIFHFFKVSLLRVIATLDTLLAWQQTMIAFLVCSLVVASRHTNDMIGDTSGRQRCHGTCVMRRTYKERKEVLTVLHALASLL
jgi:hypothetical protein